MPRRDHNEILWRDNTTVIAKTTRITHRILAYTIQVGNVLAVADSDGDVTLVTVVRLGRSNDQERVYLEIQYRFDRSGPISHETREFHRNEFVTAL
ncbi:MAG TPA: hypothetical protein VHT50_29485 [Mycobacterium sp.]|jgi:hypothetical protein|nr:hypothetical protein [Mycobacterium sp.]